MSSKDDVNDLLTRGVEQITLRDHLLELLESGQKLRIKHGVDPTSQDLHLGHAVIYWKLRKFQDLGHTVIFLIGDFTARFGDPTDKSEQRSMRSKAEVQEAARLYLEQVSLILDLEKTEVRSNSEWYDVMSAEELLRLASQFTVAQMLERDMFEKRLAAGKVIGLHEPLYPVLQGYDSVKLESDLTIVGSDQLFNELSARPLQEKAGQTPQDVMTLTLLVGTDGKRKMSQSLHNEISLSAPANEQYGRVMSIPDEAMSQYFRLATRLPIAEIEEMEAGLRSQKLHPKVLKHRLAREIVTLYHGVDAAHEAQQYFENVFQKKEIPDSVPEQTPRATRQRLDHLLVELELADSASAAQRLVESGAVRLDGAVMGDWHAEITLHDGMIVQVGKRHFRKIRQPFARSQDQSSS